MSFKMKRLLTICIFTFNDAKYWKELVFNALSTNDERFQIVLQDNCSTDETKKIAKSIKDKRFIYRRNIENIGAPLNAVKSLQDNNSEYCMLAMTRDQLNSHVLNDFLEYLEKEHPDFGILTITSQDMNFKKEIYSKGLNALSRSYLGQHSTGHFWKTSLIDRELSTKRFWENIKDTDFIHDLINGGAAVDHTLTEINMKVFTHIKYQPHLDRPTYTNPQDIFFLPTNRIKTLNVYFAHINSLDIDNEIKEQTAQLLLKHCIEKLTYGITRVYQMGNIHYKTPPKKYGIKDYYYNYRLTLNFIKNQIYFNKATKDKFIKIIKKTFFQNIKNIYCEKYPFAFFLFKVYGKFTPKKYRLFPSC